MANTYLTRTFSTPTDGNKWTWSAWVKRSGLGSEQILFFADDGGTSYLTNLRFNDQDELNFQNRWAGSNDMYLITNEKYRDTSAWYHIVAVLDTSNTTQADRQIIYVNGTRLSNYRTETQSTLNKGSTINDGYAHRIGVGINSQNTDYFDGLMSHVHFSDGQALAPTVFGETDSVTGEWKIKTSPSFTLGTNGFTILKDGNTVTDQSSNSNNWTVGGGTLTNTEDCPSNVFATLNPLDLGDTTNIATLSNGNNYYSSTQGGYNMMVTTLGANSGKWYWEAKYISHNMHGFSDNFGINPGFTGDRIPIGTNTSYLGKTANSYAFVDAGGVYNNDVTSTYDSGATSASNLNDIVGIALDLDNNKAYYHVNGTYWNSANPNTGTGGLSINPASQTETGFYFPSISDKSSNRSYVYAFNFGNGYFGTTAITSEGTNASGIGKFEYDVPTGYTALSTKGLNE